jgi:hypothetical protein
MTTVIYDSVLARTGTFSPVQAGGPSTPSAIIRNEYGDL